MVGDNDAQAESVRVNDLVDRRNAGIDGNNQAHALFGKLADRARAESVALVEPVRI